jgi:hypothetical protein
VEITALVAVVHVGEARLVVCCKTSPLWLVVHEMARLLAERASPKDGGCQVKMSTELPAANLFPSAELAAATQNCPTTPTTFRHVVPESDEV